jgi:hypothetical protein
LLGRHTKAAVLGVVLAILAVEAVLLIRYYDRYYGSDAAPGNAAGSAPASGRTVPERTAPEATTPAGDAPSEDAAAFVHRATDGNSRANYTVLSDPRTNGDPDAVVLAEPSGSYERNIGVWYVPGKNKWSIFNQDLATMPGGATFEVIVPPADEGFVHRAGPADTFGNVTYLDDPLLNGGPDADVSVTPNWNPGGGGGVYDDHPVGVLYDEDEDRWFVYNEDGARMPRGAAFNVAVSGTTG